MSTEDKRDLNADLAICDAATAGPWALEDGWLSVFHEDSGGSICDVGDPYPRGDNKPAQNMRFIAEARTGWPHAIQRALAAEADAEMFRTHYRDSMVERDEIIAELTGENERLRKLVDEIQRNAPFADKQAAAETAHQEIEKKKTVISEGSFVSNCGITIISVSEADVEGNTVCSGCKNPLNIRKAYSQRKVIDDTTVKFYSVHKYCSVREGVDANV